MTENEPDMVNHPPHYQSDNGIECIDAIRAALGKDGFIAFLRGQVIKYDFRMSKKGNVNQDAEKAQWYQNKLVEVLNETPEESESIWRANK